MENLVLYRRYRPKSFSEVVGQEHVVKTIQNALIQDRVSHAYLFTGPRGTGKTTIARLLAKSLNCSERAGLPAGQASSKGKNEPCNKCEHCQEVNKAQTLDLIEIDAASNRGIDEIRNLRESVRFGATKGKYKIYLVDEVHMLTKEAFNAFLKTLEEPPPFVVFILATTEPHRLPATVVSRTQRFDFRRLSVGQIIERLKTVAKQEGVRVDKEAIRLIAREADGSVRDAESLLGQMLVLDDKEINLRMVEDLLGLVSDAQVREFVEYTVTGDKSGALAKLQEIVDAGHDVRQFLHSLNHYLRYLLLINIDEKLAGRITEELSDENFNLLEKQAKKTAAADVSRWLQIFARARESMERYPLPQMAVEMAIVEIFRDSADNPTKKAAPVKTASANPGDLKELTESWNKIAESLKSFNHSLFAFVQATAPKELTDGVLTISTKYSFHKERIGEIKNRRALEEAIEKTVGRRVKIECVLE